MRVKNINTLVMLTALVTLFLYPASALAVPSLGVGIEGGIYAGPPEDYLDYFNVTYTSTSGDASFIIPSSGSFSLTVWYGEDNGILTSGADIYLATNCSNGADFDFDGIDFYDLGSTNTAAAYKPLPYFGVNLGPVWIDGDGIQDGWVEIIDPNWPGAFYAYEGTINYSDLGEGDWLFAMADMDMDDGVFTNGGDQFSPRTTSATVPEPATMLLLGSGLIGLAGFGRKKFLKG